MKLILPNLAEVEFTSSHQQSPQYSSIQFLTEIQDLIKKNTYPKGSFKKLDDYYMVSQDGELILNVDKSIQVVYIVDKSTFQDIRMEKMSSDSTQSFDISSFLNSAKSPARQNISKLIAAKTEANTQPTVQQPAQQPDQDQVMQMQQQQAMMMSDPNYQSQMMYMQQMMMDPQYMQAMLASGYTQEQIAAIQQQMMGYSQAPGQAQFAYGYNPMMQGTP